MNKKMLYVVAGVVVVVLVVGAYGMMKLGKKAASKAREEVAETMVKPTETMAVEPTQVVTTDMPAGTVKTFVVEGMSFKFTPAELRVKKGDTVKVTFKNTGGFHDFVIDEFKVKTAQIKDGAQETVEFVADKAGTFEYYCSVGQHRAMGMVGKLIVE